MKMSGIGGQAILEGIMMKNGDRYAAAVRRTDGSIELEEKEHVSFLSRHPAWNRPFLRGVFVFVDSLVLGMQTLTWSASFFEEEEGAEKAEPAEEGSWKEKLAIGGTVAVSVALAVGIFMLLPMFAARLLERATSSRFLVSLAEGVLRVGVFIAYVWAISFMEDIRRTFMYHGAEHKCINCIEHGLPLTVENVRISSREHKRCGTSFMLFVMLISVVVFMFLQFDNILLRMVSRIVFVPVIAGISYEFMRLAGGSENPQVIT